MDLRIIKINIVTFLILLSSNLKSQNLNRLESNIGIIYSETQDRIFDGTGFVANKPNIVITCAHVIGDSTMPIMFKNTVTNKKYKLKLVFYKFDKIDDIAILRSEENISEFPFPIDQNPQLYILDTIFYCGEQNYYQTDKNGKILPHKPIECYVSALERINSVDFRFETMAYFGFSGGPIFKGQKVVGIISQKEEVIIDSALPINGMHTNKHKIRAIGVNIYKFIKYMN